MKEIYIKCIAGKVGVKDWQVENCVHLFEEGNTIPFISRYRKEKTGGLDDAQVAEIQHWTLVFTEMEKRKEGILSTIESKDALTPELRKRIEDCVVAGELEDLYLPFRPKRRTRATVARENGLEPLADRMWNVSLNDPEAEAAKYVKGEVSSAQEALSGARDIIAERLSESAQVRNSLRQAFRARRIETKATKAASSSPEASKYRSYFNFSMPLQKIPSHNLLAILRAQNEGFLSVGLDTDPQKCGNRIYYDFCQEHRYPGPKLADQLRQAVDDAFKRLLEPSITNEVIKEAKEKADKESVAVFGDNLAQLLLSPPVGQKRTMASTLSRCRSLEGIVLTTPISSRCTFFSPEVNSFEKTYTPPEKASGELQAHLNEYFVENLCDAFDFRWLRSLFNKVNRIFQVDLSNLYPSQAERIKALFTGSGGFAGFRNLSETGLKFHTQIRRIAGAESDVRESALLKERVAKAAGYFSDQIAEAISLAVPPLMVEIDSKETRKAFQDAAKEFLKEMRFRLDAYSQIGRDGFRLQDYLKLKTDSLLAENVSFKRIVSEFKGAEPDAKEVYSGNLHPEVLNALTGWRAMKSKELDIPEYMVMTRKAMLALADIMPSDRTGFLSIKGLGNKTWEKFGEEILGILNDYRE